MDRRQDKPITEEQSYAMLSIRQWYDTERHKIEKQRQADLRLLQQEYYHRMSNTYTLTPVEKKEIERLADGRE